MKVLVLSLGSFVSSYVSRRLIADGHAVCELDVRDIVRGRLGLHTARFLLNALTSAWIADRRRRGHEQRFDAVVYVHEPPRADFADLAIADDGLLRVESTALQATLEWSAAQACRFVLSSVWGRRAEDHTSVIAAEALVAEYSAARGLNAGIARLEELYGPQMPLTRDFSVVGTLVQAAAESRAAEVETSGSVPLEELHWPVHVRDAVDGVARLLYSRERGPVTFGGATPYRTCELIAGVSHVIARDLPVRLVPAAETGVSTHPPMLADARRSLGWRPTTGLHQGLVDVARNDPRWGDRRMARA